MVAKLIRQADEAMYLGSKAGNSTIAYKLLGINKPLPHPRQSPMDILKLLALH